MDENEYIKRQRDILGNLPAELQNYYQVNANFKYVIDHAIREKISYKEALELIIRAIMRENEDFKDRLKREMERSPMVMEFHCEYTKNRHCPLKDIIDNNLKKVSK